MPLTEDIRKTLTDPTPLYFAAGVIDKIREEAPGAFAAVRETDPKEVQAKVTDRAKETQGRMNQVLGDLDADIKKLREQTQSMALQGLGYAAEYAVKAREVYGDLAERGRGAVQSWRGEGDAPEITVEREPVRVAEPPKQQRSASTTKSGGTRTTAGGGSKGTAKSTTARSTSAKSAAGKSTQTAKNGKPSAAKKPADSGQSGKASGGSTGGGTTSSTPKSGS